MNPAKVVGFEREMNLEGVVRRGPRIKGRVVRPSAASLNSLAEVLRQAQPLYSECRSILNYLEPTEGIDSSAALYPSQDSKRQFDRALANEDAASIHQTILEPMVRNRRTVM